MAAWYDIKTHVEVINLQLFSKLEVINFHGLSTSCLCQRFVFDVFTSQKGIGTFGLTGLDRLLSFMIVRELQSMFNFLNKSLRKDKTWQDVYATLSKSIHPPAGIVGMYYQYLQIESMHCQSIDV